MIQRRGRVGRTRDGDFYHLYNKKDLKKFENKFYMENISKYILNFIEKGISINRTIKPFLRNNYNMPDEFLETYLNDLIKIKFLTKGNKITSTYTDIRYIQQKLERELNKQFQPKTQFELPLSNASFLYYYPLKEACYLVAASILDSLDIFFKINKTQFSNPNSDILSVLKILENYTKADSNMNKYLNSIRQNNLTLINKIKNFKIIKGVKQCPPYSNASDEFKFKQAEQIKQCPPNYKLANSSSKNYQIALNDERITTYLSPITKQELDNDPTNYYQTIENINASFKKKIFSTSKLMEKRDEIINIGEYIYSILKDRRTNAIDVSNAIIYSFYFCRTKKLKFTQMKDYNIVFFFESVNANNVMLGHKISESDI